MKLFLSLFLISCAFSSYAQYIGVQARYTETRSVDDLPNPPKRENRLQLSFYEVNSSGVYTPANLSNYSIWIHPEGLQYGSWMGGVLDSAGNNYPGYAWTAPKAVAYYNSAGPDYIDCNPTIATHYTVNGSQLDCGFIPVSRWEEGNESFTAPNICLPYYQYPHPYASGPGNVNFTQPVPASPPYNFYTFFCGGLQQTVIRGLLSEDTSTSFTTLPVSFVNLKGVIDDTGRVKLSWSNLNEADVHLYEVEAAAPGGIVSVIGIVFPGGGDYIFPFVQSPPVMQYRIKAVEHSGDVYYSMIITLAKPKQALTLRLYPNPVSNGLVTVELLSADPGDYDLSIWNAAWQTVWRKRVNHPGGTLLETIPISSKPPGVYQFRVQHRQQLLSKKFVHVY